MHCNNHCQQFRGRQQAHRSAYSDVHTFVVSHGGSQTQFSVLTAVQLGIPYKSNALQPARSRPNQPHSRQAEAAERHRRTHALVSSLQANELNSSVWSPTGARAAAPGVLHMPQSRQPVSINWLPRRIGLLEIRRPACALPLLNFAWLCQLQWQPAATKTTESMLLSVPHTPHATPVHQYSQLTPCSINLSVTHPSTHLCSDH
jgi:hypothetical protein